jgi:hypothetical protein
MPGWWNGRHQGLKIPKGQKLPDVFLMLKNQYQSMFIGVKLIFCVSNGYY